MSGLIFQHTWPSVINETKTLTSRLKKSGEELVTGHVFPDRVLSGSSRLKWCVGDTYALMPGRGKRAVWWRDIAGQRQTIYDEGCAETMRLMSERALKHDGWQQGRVRVLKLWKVHVQDITEEQALAEGCEPIPCSYCGGYGWCEDVGMDEDPERPGEPIPVRIQAQCQACGGWGMEAPASYTYEGLWNDIHTAPGTTWDDNPKVWRIQFELVKGA